MSHSEPLSQWIETVSTAFPKLSRPQAKVLAFWSYRMVLAKACGITLVCVALAFQLGCSEACLVQRLREWCYGAQDKKGKKRGELDVSLCCKSQDSAGGICTIIVVSRQPENPVP